MQTFRFDHALCKSLVLVALAVGTARADDDGGTDAAPSIDWQTSYREAADDAARDGKPLIVRITATWCRPCQQMKQLTFTDSRVVSLVKSSFVPLLIDADAHPDLVSGFKVEAYPTTLVVSSDLNIVKRMTGFQSADSLLGSLLPLAKFQPPTSSGDEVSALIPENGIKYAFDGYCLVSLLEETRIRKGSPEFVAVHLGQIICFQSEEQREKFLQEPEKYWPVANGQCLVSSREGSTTGPGDIRLAVTWRGRIWLFSDRERQRRFIRTPFYYANEM
jgi:thiol-disulfide isomerase/thioredoxin